MKIDLLTLSVFNTDLLDNYYPELHLLNTLTKKSLNKNSFEAALHVLGKGYFLGQQHKHLFLSFFITNIEEVVLKEFLLYSGLEKIKFQDGYVVSGSIFTFISECIEYCSNKYSSNLRLFFNYLAEALEPYKLLTNYSKVYQVDDTFILVKK